MASGSSLSATYCQYINNKWSAGMEVGHNPVHPGLVYSVAVKRLLETGFVGSDGELDEAGGGVVLDERVEAHQVHFQADG